MNEFFHQKKYLNSPNPHLDLYHATIVAICKTRDIRSIINPFQSKISCFYLVPIHASDALRRFIEALFITHTEAKLNADGHLDTLLFPDDTKINTNNSSKDDAWCQNLIHRHHQ
jgi:hypothetical protein